MRIIALVTDKVVSYEHPIAYVSYAREDDFIVVMVSHSPTMESDKMSRVTWEEFMRLYPVVANLDFHEGYWLLTRNPKGNGWNAEQRR
jgi:hypothetical protein